MRRRAPAFARSASVTGYLDEIDIPVLLSRGQADTLFDLQEAIATRTALQVRGAPVKTVWRSWGHSDSSPVPGELDHRREAEETYLAALYAAWSDHHLLGQGPAPSLAAECLRDWACAGDTRAAVAAAYASAPGGRLPATGAPALPPLAALLVLGAGAVARRRRTA